MENLTINCLKYDHIMNEYKNLYNSYDFHKYLISRDDLKPFKIILENKIIKVYKKKYNFFFYNLNYAFIYDLDNTLYCKLCSDVNLSKYFLNELKSSNIDLISGIYTCYSDEIIEIPNNNFLNLKLWETKIINTNISNSIDNLKGTRKSNIKKGLNNLNYKFDIIKDKEKNLIFFEKIIEKKKRIPIICPFFYNNKSSLVENAYCVKNMNSEILSYAGTLGSNNIAIINTIITSDLDKQLKANSTQLLIWKILEYLRSINVKYLDLAGYSSIPFNNKEKGISLFKKRWPGNNFFFLYGEKFHISKKSKFLSRIMLIKHYLTKLLTNS